MAIWARYGRGMGAAWAAGLASKIQAEQGGLVQTQAQEFAAKYSVVLQYDDQSPGGNNTGLSLTVLKETLTNQLTLAIGGSKGAADWQTGRRATLASSTAVQRMGRLPRSIPGG